MIIRDECVALLRSVGVEAEDPPDVMVADIRMPPTFTDDGLHLVRRLRTDRPTIGALVLSTYAETPIAVRLVENGSRGMRCNASTTASRSSTRTSAA